MDLTDIASKEQASAPAQAAAPATDTFYFGLSEK
jgi:hypothetical protein